jgi:hypothetical protein
MVERYEFVKVVAVAGDARGIPAPDSAMAAFIQDVAFGNVLKVQESVAPAD